jgi:acetylglutamate kinase
MSESILVAKVGGNELDDPVFLDGLVHELASHQQRLLLVHGGGKEISAALSLYGHEVTFVEGLRVTTDDSMAVMEMVVCGRINRRLVARLVSTNRHAIGLSGVDVGLVRCIAHRPNGINLGRVGEVTSVDTIKLLFLLATGWLPVLAPVALGQQDGLPYNINADHMALALAGALSRSHADYQTGSVELVFVSNVPGVLLNGHVADYLDDATAEQYIADGTISGGMIPKVRSALNALEKGVSAVRITNLAGFRSGGTRIGKRV